MNGANASGSTTRGGARGDERERGRSGVEPHRPHRLLGDGRATPISCRGRSRPRQALEKAGGRSGTSPRGGERGVCRPGVAVTRTWAGTRAGERQRRCHRIGHPIGASGARVLTTLLHEMKRPTQRGSPRCASAGEWACDVRGALSAARIRPPGRARREPGTAFG